MPRIGQGTVWMKHDEWSQCRKFDVLLFVPLQQFLAKGEYDKAIRFCDKSLRLYPLPGSCLRTGGLHFS
jgi:hypothetical protein